MTTDRLYEFLVLSRALSFSKAAGTLFISQSALSKHIAELEKELGLSLFERDNHSVRLTPAGMVLSRDAYAFLDKCNSTESLLKVKNLVSEGTLRIACVLEFSYASHIRIFLSQFTQRYPQIQMQLNVIPNGVRPETLKEYDILFAPCEFQNLPSSVHQDLVRSHFTYAAVCHGHELLAKNQVKLSELAGQTLIVPFAEELFGPYAQNMLLTKKLTHDKISCFSVPNLSTALTEVAIGRGICIVPRYAQYAAGNNMPFFIRIDNPSCRFHEYIYWDENNDNGAAKLFYEEFCNTYIRNHSDM